MPRTAVVSRVKALQPITAPRAPVPGEEIIERWPATSSVLLTRRSPDLKEIDAAVGSLLQAREDPARLMKVLAAIYLWRRGKRDPSTSVRRRSVADLERRIVHDLLALSPVTPSGVSSGDAGERPDFGGFGALSRSSSQVSGHASAGSAHLYQPAEPRRSVGGPSAGGFGPVGAGPAGAGELPSGPGGSPGDGALVDERLWTRYASEWSAVLNRMADPGAGPPNLEEQPEGFPPDREAAFASYARARDGHHAAARDLAEAKVRVFAEPALAAARELRERVRAAARRLAVAQQWLAAWGMTDAERAWEKAQAFSVTVGEVITGDARHLSAEEVAARLRVAGPRDQPGAA